MIRVDRGRWHSLSPSPNDHSTTWCRVCPQKTPENFELKIWAVFQVFLAGLRQKGWLLHHGLFGQKINKAGLFLLETASFLLEGSTFLARFFLPFSCILIKKNYTFLFVYANVPSVSATVQQGILTFGFDAKKGSQVIKNTHVTFSDLFFVWLLLPWARVFFLVGFS